MTTPAFETMPDPLAGRPIEQVSIAIVTGLCQLRCIYCPTHDIQRSKGFVDVDFVERLIDEVRPRIVNLQGYGEPTMHPDFERLVEIAKGEGRIAKFFSHLNRWTPEIAEVVVGRGVDQVIVSIDAFDPETYAAIRRRGSLDDLMRGVNLILEAKQRHGTSSPELLFNTVIFKDNVEQISRAAAFAAEVGEGQPVYELVNDYGLDTIRLLNLDGTVETEQELLAVRELALAHGWQRTLQNVDFNLDSLRAASVDEFVCHRPWRLLTVRENGEVIPCGEYHEAQECFGNVMTTPVDEVWNSEAARAFRATLSSGRSQLEVCSRCTVNEGATADLFDPWRDVDDR